MRVHQVQSTSVSGLFTCPVPPRGQVARNRAKPVIIGYTLNVTGPVGKWETNGRRQYDFRRPQKTTHRKPPMTRLIASVFSTLDGVVEEPERWNAPYVNDEFETYSREILFGADALLLGRKTYEVFADAWPTRTGEFADRLNGLQKYVVSRTLEDLEWENSTLLGGDLSEGMSTLRRAEAESVVIYGSGELVRGLIADSLLDELRLWVHPLVRGGGVRLFDGTNEEVAFELHDVEQFESSVAVLTYRPRDESR